ncbi:MAG TPA: hypothetical protein VMF29_04455 [Candidatus Edwardsbacteria bacterium]|nr:hypothetical protein [Candidatus Edwardsbacteria bacterium]
MLRKIAILLFLYHAVGTCTSQARTKAAIAHGQGKGINVQSIRVVLCGSSQNIAEATTEHVSENCRP